MMDLLQLLGGRRDRMAEWFDQQPNRSLLPLYASMDVRDAGFKAAVIDTNLFPAGFNNLCGVSIDQAQCALSKAVFDRVASCRRVLLICEDHTRNAFYVDNVAMMKRVFEQAGFEVVVGAFFWGVDPPTQQPSFEINPHHGEPLHVQILSSPQVVEGLSPDLIVLNNDLSNGFPDWMRHASWPVYPDLDMGWHRRLKSQHFRFANQTIDSFAGHLNSLPQQTLEQ